MKPRAHDPATADLQRALARHTVYDLAACVLDDPDPGVRRERAHSLARLGPVAMSAIPQLAAALRDPSPSVRAEAAVTLTAIWNAMTGAREGVLGRR
jgi:HEAT repeat protein